MLNVAKTKKSNRYCAAINCTNNYRNRPDLSFFRFPRDPERYVTLVLYPQMSVNICIELTRGMETFIVIAVNVS